MKNYPYYIVGLIITMFKLGNVATTTVYNQMAKEVMKANADYELLVKETPAFCDYYQKIRNK